MYQLQRRSESPTLGNFGDWLRQVGRDILGNVNVTLPGGTVVTGAQIPGAQVSYGPPPPQPFQFPAQLGGNTGGAALLIGAVVLGAVLLSRRRR